MGFHAAGALSSFFFLLNVYGVWLQLRTIRERKAQNRGKGWPTSILTLNRFNSAFLAYYAFMTVGILTDPLNHYLVWTRLLAAVLTIFILWEIFIDRSDRASLCSFFVCTVAFVAVISVLVIRPTITTLHTTWAQAISVGVTLFIGQSYIGQIRMIRSTKSTGAIDIRTHQLLLCKDISTFIFGISMGWDKGWPVLLLSGVSSLNQLVLLWNFRWARLHSIGVIAKHSVDVE